MILVAGKKVIKANRDRHFSSLHLSLHPALFQRFEVVCYVNRKRKNSNFIFSSVVLADRI